jgi:hypothetical protein
MKSSIEMEIYKTLECMNEEFDIHPSALFAEKLNARIADVRMCRSVGYRNRSFYPVAIFLMLVLNVAAGLISFRAWQPINEVSGNQTGVLAKEYGIRQSEYTPF